MTALTLGYSPCPNDTFIFCAMIQGRISDAPKCREVLEDIETLNTLALKRELDLTKISFHASATCVNTMSCSGPVGPWAGGAAPWWSRGNG